MVTSLLRRFTHGATPTPNFFWIISSKLGQILLCFNPLRVDSILFTSLSHILMTLSCLAFAVSYTCFLTWSKLVPCTGLACFCYPVLPFVLFIIPLVPKLLYRSIWIISLSVSEWLYNTDGSRDSLVLLTWVLKLCKIFFYCTWHILLDILLPQHPVCTWLIMP